MIDTDLKKFGQDIQALFVNIKWKTATYPYGVKIEDFVSNSTCCIQIASVLS